MSDEKPVPPRLTVLLAREARTGVIFRRGPTDVVGVYGWDRAKGEVREGQWFRGRIYAYRSDLSPDGRHMIYFAGKGERAWTAVSRAPYIKALDFMPQDDRWNGGGYFVNDRFYMHDPSPFAPGGVRERPLPDGYESPLKPYFRSGLTRKAVEPWQGECLGRLFPRLHRDGWTTRDDDDGPPFVWERPLKRGWRLRKLVHATVDAPIGRGVYYETHVLVPPERSDRETVERPDWEWADVADDRLFWCANGCLLRGSVEAAIGEREPKLVHDFRGDSFKSLQAPY